MLERGVLHIKVYGDVGWFFTKNSLNIWVPFCSKILRKGSHFTEISKNKKQNKKPVNQQILELEKPLEMSPYLWKFRIKNVKSAVFWVRKILRYVFGFSDLGLHTPSKNNSSTPRVCTHFKWFMLNLNMAKNIFEKSMINWLVVQRVDIPFFAFFSSNYVTFITPATFVRPIKTKKQKTKTKTNKQKKKNRVCFRNIWHKSLVLCVCVSFSSFSCFVCLFVCFVCVCVCV